MLPPPPGGGRPRTTDPREILNALLDHLRTGCARDLPPHDFPRPGTASGHFSKGRGAGTIERIHDTLHRAVREASEPDPEPSAARRESQPVKTTEVGGIKGSDAGKKVKGRERHLLVDTPGLRIAAAVTPAGVADYHGAGPVWGRVTGRRPRLEVIGADGVSEKQWLIDWVRVGCGRELRVTRRSDKAKGFQVVPGRWVVERRFGWWGRSRRPGTDDEVWPVTSEAMIVMAMIHVMVRRLEPTSQDPLASQEAGVEAP